MKIDKQFVNTFEDRIRLCGAMDKSISDGAKVETSGCAKDLFRAYDIGNCHSKAHQQQKTLPSGNVNMLKAPPIV